MPQIPAVAPSAPEPQAESRTVYVMKRGKKVPVTLRHISPEELKARAEARMQAEFQQALEAEQAGAEADATAES